MQNLILSVKSNIPKCLKRFEILVLIFNNLMIYDLKKRFAGIGIILIN